MSISISWMQEPLQQRYRVLSLRDLVCLRLLDDDWMDYSEAIVMAKLVYFLA